MSGWTQLINGDPQGDLTVVERGLHYGDGLFETVPVIDGRLLLWEQHLHRLIVGAKRLHIEPPALPTLTAEARELTMDVARGVLKIIVIRRAQGRGYRPTTHDCVRILTLYPWPLMDPESKMGARVTWCRTRLARQPLLAGLKHLNRLEQVLAQYEWGAPFDEGLMLDEAGCVIEGTMTNLFVGMDGCLVTPSLTYSGVAGVMRDQVLLRARNAGIPIEIKEIQPVTVLAADEVFLTNSIRGLWPVRRVAEKTYSLGPLTQQINDLLEAHGDVAAL